MVIVSPEGPLLYCGPMCAGVDSTEALCGLTADAGAVPCLFDVTSDPYETTDLATSKPEKVEEMLTLLQKMNQQESLASMTIYSDLEHTTAGVHHP